MTTISPAKLTLTTKCSSCGQSVEVNQHAAKYVTAGKPIYCPDCMRSGRQWTMATYQDYLKSDHWRRVRERALKRADHKCQLCSSPNSLQVHHNNYTTLGGERPSDLVVLCDDCHKTYHGVI